MSDGEEADRAETPLEFALEEYRALRAEILERSRQDQAIQRNCLIATGAVYAFVFSNFSDDKARYGLWIVPVLFLITLLQTQRHKAYGKRIGDYLRLIETTLYKDAGGLETKGWEHFLKPYRDGENNTEMQEADDTKSLIEIVLSALFPKARLRSRTALDEFVFAWAFVLSSLIALTLNLS